MKFTIEINDQTIREAAKTVSTHYKDEAFLDRVRAIKRFNLTTDTGIEVADKIRDCQILMIIRPYKTANPWSSVIGYATGNIIFVNLRKLWLSLMDRVQNFMHEPLHLLGYRHDGNTPSSFNDGTVPYLVAYMFRQYIIELKGMATEVKPFQPYPKPWWKFW